jgi:hypothetical protein
MPRDRKQAPELETKAEPKPGPPSALLRRVTSRVTPELFDEVQELANGRDTNAIVIEALTAWVAAQRQPKPFARPQRAATPQDIAPVIAPQPGLPWNAYRPAPPRRFGA